MCRAEEEEEEEGGGGVKTNIACFFNLASGSCVVKVHKNFQLITNGF